MGQHPGAWTALDWSVVMVESIRAVAGVDYPSESFSDYVGRPASRWTVAGRSLVRSARQPVDVTKNALIWTSIDTYRAVFVM